MILSWLPAASLTAFLLASLLLALSPGPGVLYIVTNSALHGRSHGLVSAAAMALGNLVCGIAVAWTLAALTAISAPVVTTLRYAGAAYLVFLGARRMLASSTTETPAMPDSQRQAFVDGLLVALLNPKTLLFFAAFLPQFMDARTPSFLKGAELALVFVLMAWLTDSGYALAAGWLAKPLQRSRRAGTIARIIGGGVLIALGVLALLY